jgi:hypothetical protein
VLFLFVIDGTCIGRGHSVGAHAGLGLLLAVQLLLRRGNNVFTFQNLVDRARVPLNDSAKVRYTDAELLGYAVDAFLLLRRYRPDLFIGNWTLETWSTLTLGSTFPRAPDEYLPIIADYVTARAEFKDDEHVVAERAQAFYALASSGLRG